MATDEPTDEPTEEPEPQPVLPPPAAAPSDPTAGAAAAAPGWLSPGLATSVFVAVAFWVVVLALPEESTKGIGWRVLILFLLIGGVLAVLGVWLLIENKTRITAIMSLVAGVALIGVGIALTSKLDLDPGRRLGIGVGGLAVAALFVGLQRFDTIRATVALPITVLFIGIVTWPDSEDLIGEDLRIEITKWVGLLLGATAVAEGVTQAAVATAEGKAKVAAIAAGSDLEGAGGVAGTLVATPPGDVGQQPPS